MIEVQQLHKRYADDAVLTDINLRIDSTGVVAIIGPNGAGKSTLLTIMSRLQQPSHGRVRLDGEDIHQMPTRQLAQRLAILRQENHFVSRLTVRELVSFGRYPHSQGKLRQRDWQSIEQALSFLDLLPLQHRYLDQLSGGQRQRAYVAMVLCQETDYVLLDEPLNNLDIHHAVSMMKLIRRAADELKRTIIIVIHDINFAAAYADQIIALKDGQIACQGTPTEIMRTSVLSPIFNLPITIAPYEKHPLAVFYR
ncbi:ABC transporter ATP-binding protein [Idiomarina xiamenensis]|uniref:Iron(III) dicitrate transport ATP-binding protein FecE n=1 Tax=Idiomarina xiamenensis 10-D-4 TaxID=740709 RepID=K2KWP7_9GAMM|nr:ATP-binding cassette domain-containing protein [Idiomarina xiamenensis]EKE82080.1 iron(III) dicitrate transport ATP-binding protein FecE [Idiomarina xiamenensis 10-D-4]